MDNNFSIDSSDLPFFATPYSTPPLNEDDHKTSYAPPSIGEIIERLELIPHQEQENVDSSFFNQLHSTPKLPHLPFFANHDDDQVTSPLSGQMMGMLQCMPLVLKPFSSQQQENFASSFSDQFHSIPNLTEKKQAFLNSPQASWFMYADRVEAIANFYQKKYPGVMIFKKWIQSVGTSIE